MQDLAFNRRRLLISNHFDKWIGWLFVIFANLRLKWEFTAFCIYDLVSNSFAFVVFFCLRSIFLFFFSFKRQTRCKSSEKDFGAVEIQFSFTKGKRLNVKATLSKDNWLLIALPIITSIWTNRRLCSFVRKAIERAQIEFDWANGSPISRRNSSLHLASFKTNPICRLFVSAFQSLSSIFVFGLPFGHSNAAHFVCPFGETIKSISGVFNKSKG